LIRRITIDFTLRWPLRHCYDIHYATLIFSPDDYYAAIIATNTFFISHWLSLRYYIGWLAVAIMPHAIIAITHIDIDYAGHFGITVD